MRLVLIQDHLRAGGTEQQSVAIANGLATRGVETHLIVFRKGGSLTFHTNQAPFLVHYLRQGILKTDWFAPGLWRLLATLEPDAVIPMGRMANCHAGLLARNPHRAYRILATLRTGRSIPFLYRQALKGADHIVANSHEALGRLSNRYRIHRPDTSSVIYNGCIRDFDTFLPNLAPRSSSETAPLHLCSVSIFRPQKQQIRLIRICSRLPSRLDWKLTLAGDGPTRPACQAEAERLGVSRRVHFPGLLKDPRPLYFDCDLALHASEKESLPNFLVEAQMAGLPVIAYDVNGVSETFQHERTGLLIPHPDHEAFLQAIVALAEDPQLRLRYGEAARTFARSRFTLLAQTTAYHSLLNRVCKKELLP